MEKLTTQFSRGILNCHGCKWLDRYKKDGNGYCCMVERSSQKHACIAKYAIQKKSVANFMRQVILQRDTRERPNSGVSAFKQILKDCVKCKCLMRWK